MAPKPRGAPRVAELLKHDVSCAFLNASVLQEKDGFFTMQFESKEVPIATGVEKN